MNKVPFEEQNPGDVRYGSFSVDELEAMGFAPMHDDVQKLQELTRAKKNIHSYVTGLHNYANEIMRLIQLYTEYEIRIAPFLTRAAEVLRQREEHPKTWERNFEGREFLIQQLSEYIRFLKEYPDTLAPDKAENLAMVVRLLQEQ